jgi:seryl-tRNA synthetase
VSCEVENPLDVKKRQNTGAGKEPKSTTELDFTGNSQDWSFVYFGKLPNNTSLKTNDQPGGYDNSEAIKPETWYWFKVKLPLILEIKPSAQSPVNISFWFGSPSDPREKERAKAIQKDGIREFTLSHDFKKDTPQQTVAFNWEAGGGGGVTPTSTGSPSPKPIPNPTPESSWWTDLTRDDPLFGLLLLVILLAILALLAWLFLPGLLRRIRDWRRSRSPKRSTPVRSSPLDSLTDRPGGSTHQEVTPTQGARHPKRMVSYRYDDPPPTRKTQLTQEETPGQTEDHLAQSLAPRTQVASPIVRDGKVEEVKRKLESLETALGQKVDRRDNLTDTARVDVENMLSQLETRVRAHVETRLKQSATEAVQPVVDLMNEHASSMKKELDETKRRITQASEEGDKVKEQLGDVQRGLRLVETGLKTSLADLQTALERRTVPDSFYARTLGGVLSQHIEALQDGNFEKLIGEQLNQFFQTDVARGEALQELRGRAERISAAVKEVSVQMARLNPQATDEARPQMQRVEALVTELIGLHAQLQTRRASIETTLSIPVSLHPGARQTFLDELGRGIRREIDKLSEPESYFDGALERLITADLIAIVDICDKKVALPPGSRSELEGALTRLFEEAGLRSILPRQGEPFKTAEQDLIEMDKGVGPSLTVAQVMTRGFYYTHRENETPTLLRKAGVAVYR